MQLNKLRGILFAATSLGSLIFSPLVTQSSAGQDPDPPKKIEEAKTNPELLVRQLNSGEFRKREAAAKELLAIGAPAIPAVRAGIKSGLPEVAQRCERLLVQIRKAGLEQLRQEFAADKTRKASFAHPIWVRYRQMVGDSKTSREVFGRIIAVADWAKNLDEAEADPANAGLVYREALTQVGSQFSFNSLVSFILPIWPCDMPKQVAYLLLLGSYKNTDPEWPAPRNPLTTDFAMGESRILGGRGLGLAFRGKTLAINPKKKDQAIEVADDALDAVESGRVMLKLLAHWLEQRNLWVVVSKHLKGLSEEQAKVLLPFARRVVENDRAAILCRAVWVSILRRFGNESDAVRLETLFGDVTGMDWPTTDRFGDGPGNLINQAEVREVAIGSAIYLRGRDPADFGFGGLSKNPPMKRTDEIHSTSFTVKPGGTREEKEKVLKAAIEWLKSESKKSKRGQ